MKTFLLLGRNGEAEAPLLPQVAVEEDNTVETWQEELADSSHAATPLPLSDSLPLIKPYPVWGMRLSETNLQKLQERESPKRISGVDRVLSPSPQAVNGGARGSQA
jgi:hypothetical protein